MKLFGKLHVLILFIFLCLIAGAGFFIYKDIGSNYPRQASSQEFQLDEQEATVRVIESNMPAVVNITVYETEEVTNINATTGEKTVEKKEFKRGAGTGFIITPDGYIVTNKHVVSTNDPEETQFRVILSSGKKYYAQLIDKDPINDLAVLKIYDKDLPSVRVGSSEDLRVGASVVAIGNALGEYQNTVTKGIVSGLGRSLTASDHKGGVEYLSNTIQTDAEINLGNSGGPLLNLAGEVVGVNVAVDQSGTSLGFAIPIDDVKPVIDSIKEHGIIVRPRLGVRYVMLTPQIAEERGVNRDWGALIVEGDKGEEAVMPDSAADKAGLAAGDVIFEINAVKIKDSNNLRSVIQRYKPGARIGMKVQRGDKIFIREMSLDKF
jgi:serine protease Do